MIKPIVETLQALDFYALRYWCEENYEVNIDDLLADLEAGNDSYCQTDISSLEELPYKYGPRLAKILKEDFGLTGKVAFWVCW